MLGASGGKDSTVLAHVMTTLNKRHNYGLELFLLSIDEGISGYRDDSLETVKRNQQQYQLPLTIISYKDIYKGWTMDAIVKSIGKKNNCTFCGVFRRQALDRGAQLLGADMLLTGHNCDDIAETVILNILRGDVPRAGRCVNIVTGKNSSLPRAKPLKHAYEKEIVMYAFMLKLDYFATECKYAPFAYRGFAREYIKDIERVRPSSLLDIVLAAEHFQTPHEQTTRASKCKTCGYLASNDQCKACLFIESLEKGTAKDIQTAKRRANAANPQQQQQPQEQPLQQDIPAHPPGKQTNMPTINESECCQAKSQTATSNNPEESTCCGGSGGCGTISQLAAKALANEAKHHDSVDDDNDDDTQLFGDKCDESGCSCGELAKHTTISVQDFSSDHKGSTNTPE